MSRRVKSSLFDNPFIWLILGLVLVFFGFRSLGEYRELKSKCTELTTGRISYVYRTGSTKSKGYKAEVTYLVDDDKYTLRLRKRKTRYPQGKDICVKYNSADPNVSYSPTYPPDRGIGSILLGAGMLGLFMIWLMPKEKLPDLSKLLHKDDGY